MKHPPRSHAPHGQRLFDEPERQPSHVAYVDGASRGNPGPAAYAVIVKAPGGKTEFEIGKYFGRATNNVAEYYALITALDAAQSRGIARLLVRSDSELLVRQMQGRYKVKSPDLKPLHERAQKMARGFAQFAIEHVPREQNADADALANRALDDTSRSARSASSHHAAGPPPLTAPVSRDESRERFAGSAAAQPPASRAARLDGPGTAGGSSASPATAGGSKIRARYSAGALHPLEALDLDEGEIVELSIKKTSRA